ncbi:hypothetical protein [Streptomyces ureilyticus]|uniref:Uncharacterized protein n=1 Tax=Streptomyces ureilyticus TaxID=1775131 RepID=A0ABX0DFJ3_9ACTN|nr:hypothetical protein [Streptomyces ureilyticus]NGO40641.1 hypothetical protein [Streptomyces ureilyticus]
MSAPEENDARPVDRDVVIDEDPAEESDDEKYERSAAQAARRISDYDRDPVAEELAAAAGAVDRVLDPEPEPETDYNIEPW